jgi:hypothetical protein
MGPALLLMLMLLAPLAALLLLLPPELRADTCSKVRSTAIPQGVE